MKKIVIFLITIGVFSFSFAGTEFQRIRALETASQFEDAVQQQEVILDFNRDLVIEKEAGSDYAKKRIETVFPMKNQDGSLEKELVIKCDFMIETTANKITLASTKNQSTKWKIKTIKKIGNSMERWILSKNGAQDVTLTCMSIERKGDEATKISLVPSLVDKVLSQVSGSLLTASKSHKDFSNSNRSNAKTSGAQ